MIYNCLLLKDNPCKHPVVILKDVNYEDVEALLSFVYQGVVYISEKKLASFLQTAELLQIRGLTGAATTMKEATFSDTSTVHFAIGYLKLKLLPFQLSIENDGVMYFGLFNYL